MSTKPVYTNLGKGFFICCSVEDFQRALKDYVPKRLAIIDTVTEFPKEYPILVSFTIGRGRDGNRLQNAKRPIDVIVYRALKVDALSAALYPEVVS